MLLRNKQEDFYIREHEYYWTPMTYVVESTLHRKGLDLQNTHVAKELARFFYHKMVMSYDIVEDKYKDPAKLSPEELERANAKEGFYEALRTKFVPGISPLDKAMNLLMLMKRKQKQKGGAMPSPDKMTEKDLTEVFVGVPDEEQFESSTINELFDNRADMQDFDKRLDMMQRIAMVEAFGKSFEIKKVVHERRVTNSQVHKQKRMAEYGELVNSQLYQRMMPNFNQKLVTKDLIVNTPVTSEESKQKIIMLVDFSGSMNSPQKQQWVMSIVADRLSYCIKEECEIFFCFFLTKNNLEHGTFKWYHIYNRETALEFWKHFNNSPSGGDTEVGLIIDRIRKEIMENHKLFNLNIDLSVDQPEILVINDGQDSVKTDKLTWKTNAITLYNGPNNELKSLCERTGGKYINVTPETDAQLNK